MNDILGIIMCVASLGIGIMILSGYGDFFMKGGNDEMRGKVYDPQKLNKATGVMLLVFGALTGIDCFTTAPALKLGYMVSIVIVFGVYIFYIVKKCKR